MGAQTSKEELLYQQVNYGNADGIRALRRDGAGLEWIDGEGKTPLIQACMRHDLLPVAKVLIELGANVNAYRPGSHGGTPLHHAAKRGLEQTVNLLLSHGANAIMMNDDCQTALDLARTKGYINVVRAIESRICLFSGWLRELYGPGFLEVLAPQWLSRKIWAVILPCDHRNPMNPVKFEVVIYPDLQVAKPRTTIALWKVNIEEPNFNQPDPVLVIFDKSSKTRYKFLSAHEGDKQQIVWFYNACRGMRQFNIPALATPAGAPMPLLHSAPSLTTPASATSTSEDTELAMAINASIQSALVEGVPPFSDIQPISQLSNPNAWGSSIGSATHDGRLNEPANVVDNGWTVLESSSTAMSDQIQEGQHNTEGAHDSPDVISSAQDTPAISVPTAPLITEAVFDDGPIHYPSIDSSPVDFTLPVMNSRPGTSEVKEGSDASSSCVICLDAPVEGACIPCGHMAGCMLCLSEIKAKNWGCPVCRANIDQVIKLYAV